jgi:hypothetical protein
VTLEALAKAYYSALQDMVDAIPKDSALPEWLRDPSFVIASSDVRGRTALQLFSRDKMPRLTVGNDEASPASETEPGFVIARRVEDLDNFLFPRDDPESTPCMTIGSNTQTGQMNMALIGLAFSSKSYNDKYWANAKFYRNCGGNIPFTVKASGCLLGLNLLWGTEDQGERKEILFEFIKVFGSIRLVPRTKDAISDAVFRDLLGAAGILKPGIKTTEWSFSTFLRSIESSIESSVLLLGSYTTDERLEQLRDAMAPLGYHGFLLRDVPDVEMQTNEEKLVAGLICSRFVVVVDDSPSGHIAELSTLLKIRFRPVLIVRKSDSPSTAFLEDQIQGDDLFKVCRIESVCTQEIVPLIAWANKTLESRVKSLNRVNAWRNTK